MAVVWHFARPTIPRRAIGLCFAALAVPVLKTLFWPGSADDADPLLWLAALVPAFLLAYYRGWNGAATSLAMGMVVLTATHLVVISTGRPLENWQMLFWVTLAYVAISLATGALSERLHAHRSKAEVLAMTDDLTGIWNRRRARLFLESEFEKAGNGGFEPLSVVLFDLDSFKSYNDLHGHDAGDSALRNFAETLIRTTRGPDLSARYGGEEFLTVLSSCDEEGALSFVERVRSAFRASQTAPPYLTASAGIASFRPGMVSPNEMLSAADRALYAAKKSGRDSVRIYAAVQSELQAS